MTYQIIAAVILFALAVVRFFLCRAINKYTIVRTEDSKEAQVQIYTKEGLHCSYTIDK